MLSDLTDFQRLEMPAHNKRFNFVENGYSLRS